MLGVSLESRPSYDFPVNVEIDAGDVGGPSAGLAFALAILDRLTPGQLTGGARVAVTGTMELDGTKAPQAVASFVQLANENYWLNAPCHRVVRSTAMTVSWPSML